MKANDRPVRDVFFPAAQLQVPLYQRPYVWDEDRQWAPLWDDVKRLAERLLLEQAKGDIDGEPTAIERTPPHFLGAIVLDDGGGAYGEVDRRLVIDGQQRLTTLQVLLAASYHAIKAAAESSKPAAQLQALLENGDQFIDHPDERWKVWPTNADRKAFVSVMGSDGTVDEESSRFAKAFCYFGDQIDSWIGEGEGEGRSERAAALAAVLQHRVHLVVIELEKGDNAQVIFETLNDRGERLLAADLVKNYVFQNAKLSDAEVEALYEERWRPFDVEKRWRDEVRQGRLRRPRIDVFLQHWLSLELGRDVGTSDLFGAFKELHKQRAVPTPTLLGDMADAAAVFARMDDAAEKEPQSPEGTFVRRWRRIEASTVTPVLLLLFAGDVPESARHRGLAALESYLARRMITQQTTKAYNQLTVELVAAIRARAPSEAGQALEEALLAQTADTRTWPTDDEVRQSLESTRLYGWVRQDRISMVLVAVENHLRRKAHAEHLLEPDAKFEIEHILPRAWEAYWRFPDGTVGTTEQRVEREHQLNRIGNLTLTNGRINKRLSHQPWLRSEADERAPKAKNTGEPRGKREVMATYSVLHLNKHLVDTNPEVWDEEAMATRREHLVDNILQIWPRPASSTADP